MSQAPVIPTTLLQVAEDIAPAIAERAARHDRDGSFPVDDFADLHHAGLLAMRIPRRYGGGDVDQYTYVRVLETIAAAHASTGLILNMHSSATALVARIGSSDQAERWLRPVSTLGETFGSLTSEPNVSLRKARFGTVARHDGNHYVLEGFKYFASGAGYASSYLVFASIEGQEQESAHHALGVLVRSDNPGAEIIPSWDAMGMRATNSHAVRFSRCIVPAEDVIEIDLDTQGNVTDMYLFGYGAVYLGIAAAGYKLAVEYAKSKRFGPDQVTIAHYPSIQRAVAEMTVRLEAMRGLIYRAAREADLAPPAERARLLLQAKWAGAVAARDVNDLALQVVGGAGFGRAMALERYIRDARAGIIMPPNIDACLEGIGMLALDLDASRALFGST